MNTPLSGYSGMPVSMPPIPSKKLNKGVWFGTLDGVPVQTARNSYAPTHMPEEVEVIFDDDIGTPYEGVYSVVVSNSVQWEGSF